MARTTKTPHKVSRNKSGTPIVRASKLFPGRPSRTTREAAFDTEHQAQTFADALNLAAVSDGDWSWLKGEDWTSQRRYVDEVLRLAQEQGVGQTVDPALSVDLNVNAGISGPRFVASAWDISIVEAVEMFMPVYMARPGGEASKNYASLLGAIGMAFEHKSLAEVAEMTPEKCGASLWRRIDQKDTTRPERGVYAPFEAWVSYQYLAVVQKTPLEFTIRTLNCWGPTF